MIYNTYSIIKEGRHTYVVRNKEDGALVDVSLTLRGARFMAKRDARYRAKARKQDKIYTGLVETITIREKS